MGHQLPAVENYCIRLNIGKSIVRYLLLLFCFKDYCAIKLIIYSFLLENTSLKLGETNIIYKYKKMFWIVKYLMVSILNQKKNNLHFFKTNMFI